MRQLIQALAMKYVGDIFFINAGGIVTGNRTGLSRPKLANHKHLTVEIKKVF